MASAALVAFVALVSGIFGAIISGRAGQVKPTAVAAGLLPACSPAQVDIGVTVQRRIGTRFTFIQLTATDRGSPCFLHVPIAVTVSTVTGNPFVIDGNGAETLLEGALPQQQVIAGFSWKTWCAADQTYLVRTKSSFGEGRFTFRGNTPPCPDSPAERDVPSMLAVASIAGQPSSVLVRQGLVNPFDLFAQCGLQIIDFDHTYWDVTAGQAIPASYLRGTMTLVDNNDARFDFGGNQIYFARHSGPLLVDPHSQLCD